MSQEQQTRRILGVVCGPSRPGLAEWPELITETVRKHKSVLPDGVDEAAWSQLQWEFVSLYDSGVQALPNPDVLRANYAAVIFSGSKLNTTEDIPWLEGAMSWIRTVIGAAATSSEASSAVPIMGICFGHQLIAKSLGGVVDFNPRGVELGTALSELNHTNAVGDPLWRRVFGKASSETAVKHIRMQEVHWQSVLELPRNGVAVSFAASSMCKNQWVKFCNGVYGTQFHPEYPVEYMAELGQHLPWQRVADGDEQAGDARKKAYYDGLTLASTEGCSIASAFVDMAISPKPHQV
jgi:GMP synthase-like glutamine amidotransferase